ncbi:MAG: UDP-N-acetylmuramoyl-tripeptide--D-alanyl-D-alanine ligase [Clostridiales bacterium]|nr:UDP-N-acetylmuramoyl-tripeptide--D-alanyl-D-alanine ligase [Clostridiales bacterium]
MSTLVVWLLAMGVGVSTLLASRSLMHYFQLESYQFPGYFRTVKRNCLRAITPGLIMTVYLMLLLLIHRSVDRTLTEDSLLRLPIALVTVVLALLGGNWCRSLLLVKAAKKPFVVTMRVKRTYVTCAIVFTLLCALMGFLLTGAEPRYYFIGLFPVLLPLWVALGGLCAWPIEKLVSEMYFRDAQKKLAARPDLIKIGITGSYGKTSVKFILGTVLQEKFQVLVTPSSFNTPMGVTRVIREKLMPAHQVFVAEMGARHVGDIKELCRLVHPRYGVLTSVGPQHLDTFHTLERIKSTKYELMDAIPDGGCCFFPDDQGICRELFDKTRKEKRLCSIHPGADDADVWAEDIRVSPSGSSFILHAMNDEIACQTRLLGEHNIQNILLAATVGLHLGMNLKQIARGISRIEPVEHRLQLLPSAGVTIIDDAFNANPKGAQAALRVLKAFEGRRIIITPGMVELGAGEEQFNHDFGVMMADCVDVAILVGKKHTAPIASGLREAGFPEDSLHIVSSLDEASALLRKLGRPGDVALFENDLPDNYSEA